MDRSKNPLVNDEGEWVYGSNLKGEVFKLSNKINNKFLDTINAKAKGRDVTIDYMWRGEQSSINFFVLQKVSFSIIVYDS